MSSSTTLHHFRHQILHLSWAGVMLFFAALLWVSEHPAPLFKLSTLLVTGAVLLIMSLPFSARQIERQQGAQTD